MKLAFTTLGCPNWDMDTIIRRAVEYGYDGVDFRGYGTEMAIYKLPEFSTDAVRTACKFARAGLEVSAFSSSVLMFPQDDAQRQAFRQEIAAYAALCKTFGARYIRIFGGDWRAVGRDKAIETATAALEDLARIAAPHVVAVETHDYWVDSSLLAEVFRRVKAANVGVLWDMHNPFGAGESPRTTFDNIGRWVVYTHIKDAADTAKGHSYVLPGEGGQVPLAEMINLLKGRGYDGWLTLEWEKRWIPEIAEPEIAFPAYARWLKTVLRS